MELKRLIDSNIPTPLSLLIVPYGIETRVWW